MDPKGHITMSKTLIPQKLGLQKGFNSNSTICKWKFCQPFYQWFDLGGANSLLDWVCYCASKEKKCIKEGQGDMPFV